MFTLSDATSAFAQGFGETLNFVSLAVNKIGECSDFPHQSCPPQVVARLSVLSEVEGLPLDKLGTLNFVAASGGQNWRNPDEAKLVEAPTPHGVGAIRYQPYYTI